MDASNTENLVIPNAGSPNEPQSKFLYAALVDVQAVIRATDAKVTALFFGLALPLTKLAAIWQVCGELFHKTHCIYFLIVMILVAMFALSWLISLAAALRTVFHVANPAKHIKGDYPTGVFYSPMLYEFSYWDVFFPRQLESKLQFDEYFKSLPSSELDVRRELAFELMKIIYIRGAKMKRAEVAYVMFSTWLVCGGIIWVLVLIMRSHGG